MAQWQGRSRRKPTGGRLRPHRGKRSREIGSERQFALLGPRNSEDRETDHIKIIRGCGGGRKVRILKDNMINIAIPEDNKTVRTEIITVVENPANPHYVRRNILTKGAIVETGVGKARIVSRPGQHGVINGILVK